MNYNIIVIISGIVLYTYRNLSSVDFNHRYNIFCCNNNYTPGKFQRNYNFRGMGRSKIRFSKLSCFVWSARNWGEQSGIIWSGVWKIRTQCNFHVLILAGTILFLARDHVVSNTWTYCFWRVTDVNRLDLFDIRYDYWSIL